MLMAFLCGYFTKAVLLIGCLQSFPFHSWPQSKMKTKKMRPRGLSIFLSYKLLVLLSRRISQSPIYNSFQQDLSAQIDSLHGKKPDPSSRAQCPCWAWQPLCWFCATVGVGGVCVLWNTGAVQREMRIPSQGSLIGIPNSRGTLFCSHIFL